MTDANKHLATGGIAVLVMALLLYVAFRDSLEPGSAADPAEEAFAAFQRGDAKAARKRLEEAWTRPLIPAMRRLMAMRLGSNASLLATKEPAKGEEFLRLVIDTGAKTIEPESPMQGDLIFYLAEIESQQDDKRALADEHFKKAIALVEKDTSKSKTAWSSINTAMEGYCLFLERTNRSKDEIGAARAKLHAFRMSQ
jgi:hypothetical protein